MLSRWDDPQLRVVVTYPEALAEKVAMRQQLIDSTLSFRRGGTADLTNDGAASARLWLCDGRLRVRAGAVCRARLNP